MGELNILFLRGTYLTKIEQLKNLLNDVSVTNSDDFREELLSAFRDGALASWCDKRGFALTGIAEAADNKPLYEAIVKKITGKTDFKAADKAFIGNFAEPLKEDDIKIDKDILRVTIHPIKPTNDKFRFELKNKKGKIISSSTEIDWKDKTKNTAVPLTFDLKGYNGVLVLWVNGFEELITNVFGKSFIVNGVKFNMILVKHGTFTMGATPEMENPDSDEKPAHKVTITQDYYIGETQVTQALWRAVMGNNPSSFQGDNNPVESVSWDDCQEFIKKLNKLTGKTFRLPTEAEWEYAARGGNKSKHTQYAGSGNLDEVAWYYGNSGSKTHPVAQKKPNELGLYDMSGNVWEWCNDRYDDSYYSNSPSADPQGPSYGSSLVLRGGSWYGNPWRCRLSIRVANYSVNGDNNLGLRLALQ